MADSTQFSATEFRRQIATLGEALRDGLLCPVVGAGLSQNAGLPSWDALASLMADELNLAEAERAAEPDPALSRNSSARPKRVETDSRTT